jgi:hypothetical protein
MRAAASTPTLGQSVKATVVMLACLMVCGCATDLAPHWEAERDAVPSDSHPFGGFWKSDLSNDFGMAIGPYGAGTYYVSFCGPGGCFAKGHYRPVTSLANDPEYRIIDKDTIEFHGSTGWTKYYRSQGRKAPQPNNVGEPTRASEGARGSP